jgi:Tfp pilus assembly protein PilO
MHRRFCSLIVFGPRSPRLLKIHISRGSAAVLVIAFLVSLLAVVLMGYTFPPAVSDLHRKQLESENRALKLEASNAAAGIGRLDAKVSQLEEKSRRIRELAHHKERD